MFIRTTSLSVISAAASTVWRLSRASRSCAPCRRRAGLPVGVHGGTAGEIAVVDLQIAAEQFLGGIIGHQQLRAALGQPPPSRRDIDARVEAAIQSFTTAHRLAHPAPLAAGQRR